MENTVINNIKSRRSVRDFKSEPIPNDVIDKIVEAGRFAPSALNKQPWKFIIIDDKGLIEDLSRLVRCRIKRIYKLIPLLKFFVKPLRDQRSVNALKKTAESPYDTVFYNAPLLIFIANDKRLGKTEADCYLAAQNVILAAHSMSVGSCIIGRGNFIPKKFLLKKISLPAFYDIGVHIALGYPNTAQKAPPPRKDDTILRV